MRVFPRSAAGLLCVAAALWPAAAGAVDEFEIQVYDGTANAPGEAGLELHLNYTLAGRTAPDFAGEIPPDRVFRATFEPSYGLFDWLELGGYIQTLLAPSGAAFGGLKARLKLLAPPAWELPVKLGANFELSWIPRRVEEGMWGTEIRPIIAWSNRWVLLAFNPIIGTALAGNGKFQPELEPALKAAFDTQLGFALGLEYYAGLGPLSDVPPVRDQQHLLFAVFDLAPKPGGQPQWELNLALGRGLTGATDQQWVAKAILGHALF